MILLLEHLCSTGSIASGQSLSHGTRGRASARTEILVLRVKLGGDVTSAALRGLNYVLAYTGQSCWRYFGQGRRTVLFW